MSFEIVRDFVIRRRFDDFYGAPNSTQTGHVRHGYVNRRVEARYRNRNSATLTDACNGNLIGCDRGMLACSFHSADTIGENSAVIVRLGVENPPREKTREMRVAASRFRIRGVALAPATALSACIHNEVCVASTAPQQPVGGKPSSTPIADVFHHTWHRTGTLARQDQPGLNGLSTET